MMEGEKGFSLITPIIILVILAAVVSTRMQPAIKTISSPVTKQAVSVSSHPDESKKTEELKKYLTSVSISRI